MRKMKKFISIALVIALSALLLAGCGKKNEEINEPNATAQEIWDAIEEKADMDDMPSFMELGESDLEGFYGLSSEEVESFSGRVSMMNINATEIFIAKAVSGKENEVKSAIESRIEDLDRLWSEYLPDQYDLVKNHVLKQNGSYFLFAVSTQNEVIEEAFNDMTTLG